MPDSTQLHSQAIAPEHNQYQTYSIEEDSARSAYHYEQDPEFYFIHTGGEWNVYSCLMWEPGFTVTQAQEKKLDKLAEVMQLKPGMHILDVGCGWGGPLVYLCRKYNVTGHGITVSPKQETAARARAARYGVPATFQTVHWQTLPEVAAYDAIYSDEVIVHFNDLGGFFAKCYRLLKPGGTMAHKELHFAHSRYCTFGRAGVALNKVFGYTGNYVQLYQELRLLEQNNFQLTHIFDVPMENYYQTMDTWLKNVFDNRERLKEIAGPEFYKDFRTYLKVARFNFTTGQVQLHIVGSRKMEPETARASEAPDRSSGREKQASG